MDELHWKEISQGRFERFIDEVEGFYIQRSTEGEEFGKLQYAENMAIRVRIKTEDFVAAVKQAWITIRYDHPSIASTVKEGKRYYQIADSQELETWLAETVLVVDGSTPDDIVNKLPPVDRPCIYIMPKGRYVLLRSAHAWIDGLGTVLLLSNLARLLENPRSVVFGDEHKNLSPSFIVAADIPTAEHAEEDKVQDLIANMGMALPSIALPVRNLGQPPRDTRRQQLLFSQADTARIIAATKLHGMTVTMAFHTALILATQRVGGNQGEYVNMCFFNLRKQCHDPYSTSMHPVASYHTSWPIVVSPGSFVITAEQVKNYYTEWCKFFDNNKAALATARLYNKTMAQLAKELPPPSATSAPSPTLSNLGVLEPLLESTYGAVEVEDFWLALDLVDAEIATHLLTFRGQLKVTVAFCETYYTDAVIAEYISAIKSIIFEGLGLID